MKYMVLIILLSTMLFSYEKYIIVGSYKNSVNSVNSLKRLKWLSVNDTKLKDLIEKNSLKIVSKKMKKYEVVALQALNSDVQLLGTLKVLEKYYDGHYVLHYNQKEEKVDLPTAVKNKIENIPAIVDNTLDKTSVENKTILANTWNKTAVKNKTEDRSVIVDYTWDKTTKRWVELVPEKKIK